ncbi:indolepyruvate ferredoxin oxidoreductase beta subunit [Anaerospora hongkongensis]|uniref:Indolepyruvate ferredoxin oxidoreductase beta subunit n=1 Tax=Anaerospora hongkongensis TaxID=244830 RepID=A0A4R1Q3C6_9FIRM|nr:indolepyruvate oxidoreductase subunit beta [Anaerospora hongkongensis]TCL35679.1 indolepyruvate ferredoxin oxidoreductase beta subunit [Anaerospora hongkongensis]
MKLDLVIAGVGGQGNILASQTLAKCAMDEGYTVVNTETKGAAQRGGSVLSHLRISSRQIYSPLVPKGQADILLGFEPLEAMRYMSLLSKQGKYIINTAPVPTILAKLNVDQYPSREEMLSTIGQLGMNGHFIDATRAASELGDVLLTNVVMLGAFTGINDLLSPESVLKKLLSQINEKYHAADERAFYTGRKLIQDLEEGM